MGASSAGDEDVILCCSGGGIRSAAFCLGALQALQTADLFRRVTTITAVSGGSYIAAAWSLQRCLLRSNPNPDRDPVKEPAFSLGSPEERHLRDNTRYIAPDAPTSLFGICALVLGIVVNLITVGVPLLFVSTLLGWALRGAGFLRLGSDASADLPWWLWLGCFGPLLVGIVTSWVMYLFTPTRDREILVGRRFRAAVDLEHSPTGPQPWHVQAWHKLKREDPAATCAVVAWLLARVSAVAVACFVVAPLVVSALWRAGTPSAAPSAWAQVVQAFGFGTHHGHAPLATVPAVIGALATLARTAVGKIRTYQKDLDGTLSNSKLSAIGGFVRDRLAPYLGVLVVIFVGAVFSWAWVAVGVRTAPYGSTSQHVLHDLAVGAVALGGWLVIRGFVDVNHTSLHRYYRDRLAAAYVGDLNLRGDRTAALSSLRDGDKAPVPDLVLCASAADTGTGDLPPGRNAVSFTFTPQDVGLSTSAPDGPTRRADTRQFEDAAVAFTLFDAVAVAGAALSPLMGRMTTPSKRILFALTNVRLGMWLPSPAYVTRLKPKSSRFVRLRRFGIRIWRQHNVRRLWAEMAGTMHLDGKWLYVTDGGHYENLGLVEALRRRPRMVVVLDASGDRQGSFTTLGQAIALARTECGVDVTIDPEAIGSPAAGPSPQGAPDDREVARTVVAGSFTYRDKPESTGTLLYARLGVTPSHPWDVRSYLRSNANFPTTTTLAQLYDGAEFEAYRAMGEKTGQDVLAESRRSGAPPDDVVPPAPGSNVALPLSPGGPVLVSGGGRAQVQALSHVLRLRLYRLAEGRRTDRL